MTRRRDGAQLPGVESEAAVEARARSFHAEIADLPGSTLVVGRGRMLRILIATCVLRVPAAVSGSASLHARNMLPRHRRLVAGPGCPARD